MTLVSQLISDVDIVSNNLQTRNIFMRKTNNRCVLTAEISRIVSAFQDQQKFLMKQRKQINWKIFCRSNNWNIFVCCCSQILLWYCMSGSMRLILAGSSTPFLWPSVRNHLVNNRIKIILSWKTNVGLGDIWKFIFSHVWWMVSIGQLWLLIIQS